ncbi:MAG: hydrolase, partial [Actinomycetota bacterium]|nr:hydrolase [Actinomycetota bacterium]
LIQLTLDPCWHQLKPGHRLQLLVTGGAHRRFASAADAGLDVQPHTILHAGTTLRLPVVEAG